ncbi:uncharacterized protein Hap1MRO34_004842 [Clarias gariepinus]
MSFMWKCFICCAVVVLMENLSVSEGSSWCCVDVLANSSVRYTLNTTGCRDGIWNLNETCIKDQHGDKDDATVIMYGPNSILLYRDYSGVNYVCMDDGKEHTPVQCTDRCEIAELRSEDPGGNRSHEDDEDDGGHVLSTGLTVAVISVTIIIIIIIIGWSRGCYRFVEDPVLHRLPGVRTSQCCIGGSTCKSARPQPRGRAIAASTSQLWVQAAAAFGAWLQQQSKLAHPPTLGSLLIGTAGGCLPERGS